MSPLNRQSAKPIAMISDILRDTTTRGGVILDAFHSTGSSLLAAEEVGRICCAIEPNPKLVDIAVRRWEKMTGRDAVRSDGKAPEATTNQPLLKPPLDSDHGR